MEYVIDHQTTYQYASSVYESYTVVHLQPRSDPNQFCTRFHLEIEPAVRSHSYVDRYGNDVQHFAVMPRHGSLAITAHSSVMTLLERAPQPPVGATRASLSADARVARFWDFLHESTYVKFTPELAAFAAELGEPGERVGAWCHRVARSIHEGFRYQRDATTVRTTVAEAIGARAGVCQDFAHVMIAVLRAAAIPARYASGYIFGGGSRVLGAEASHAWCEAYLPPYGWVGFDPTNDRVVDDHFVKIAIGRDYRDVSPVRGIYRGSGKSELSVNVAMDVLVPQNLQQ